jgi:glycosyltransferase involved in cell wall biosynthesis
MKVLILYIEPAPYILDLIRVIRQRHPELELGVLFISGSVSQAWNTSLDGECMELLPVSRLAAARRILSDIKRGDFDWLHLAGWGHPLLMWALLTGGIFRRRISMESDTQLAAQQSGWKEQIKSLLYPRLFQLAELLFPAGTRQRTFFEFYGVPQTRIRTAQMTVDVSAIFEITEAFKEKRAATRATIGLPSDAVVFVYVGRLEDYKGLDLLLKAFKTVDGTNRRLLIVGDGSMRAEVQRAATDEPHILYLGRKDFSGVIESLVVSDVALVPSTFEPWGLVVNEAMAAGLPIIASDRVGCVDDLVLDRRTGIVFPSGELNQLVNAMALVATDSVLRTEMGRAGRELISGWRLEDEAQIMANAWRNGARN